MNLLDVLKETNIIEADGDTIEDLFKGDQEKKEWANMTPAQQAKIIRQREEKKEENKDKDKAWFDKFEQDMIKKIKSKEENLSKARRAGGLANADQVRISSERREGATKKADDIKKSEGKYYDMDYKDAIAEFDDASKKDRDKIIRRVAREISKDKRNANTVMAELNKIEDKEAVKDAKEAINDFINPEGKGKHSQGTLKKNIEKVAKDVDKESNTMPLRRRAEAIVTSWKGSGKEEEETLNNFVKDGKNKSKAKDIIKNYMPEEIAKEIDNANDEQLKKAAKSVVTLWQNDKKILQKFASNKNVDEEKVKEILKDVEEKGRKNFETILNSINKASKEANKGKDDKAKDTENSVEEIMNAIEKRKEEKNKMYQLLMDKGDVDKASKEAMKDQPKVEKRRFELLKKKEEEGLTDEEKDELDDIERMEESINESFNEEVDPQEFKNLFKTNSHLIYLKEGLGYRGINFDKNYYASAIIKSFVRDYNKYGENIVNFYEDTWGDWDGAFRLAANNIYTLQEEVSTMRNSMLIFEAIPSGAGGGGAAASLGLFGRAKNTAAAGGGVLAKVWDKVKGLGKEFYENRLGPFLQKGFTWAKELAQKGIEFFSNISPSVAIPIALSIAGITSIAALKNKKKRKKAEQLLAKNKEALAKLEGKEDGIDKYMKQVQKLEQVRTDGNRTVKPA